MDKELAQQFIDAVGGVDNISTLGHCMTRLRFTLKDESKANDEVAKKLKGVKGLAKAGGQYMLIIGTGTVDEYYDYIASHYKIGSADYGNLQEDDSAFEKKKITPAGVLNGALNVISGSIAPWLGCIMGSLMITAILALLTSIGILSTESSTYTFFSTVAGACVYSLPVLVGYSAAEKLGTNKYMGALLGAIMIYPNMMAAVSEGTVSVFGLPVQNFSYTSSFIPVLLAVWVLKYVEKLAKKICPKVIFIFGVTLIELVITVPIIYLVVGPIGVMITNAIAAFVLWVDSTAGFLAIAVVGAIMPLAVMAGVHIGLFPIAAMLVIEAGYDPVIHPALLVYNFAVAGTSFAYGLRSKDANEKSLGISSGISGVLGISEAGLFGVMIPNKRILATSEIGILVSGVIAGIVGYKCYVPMSQSLFSIPAAANPNDPFNLMACVISSAAALIISFVVTFVFGFGKKEDAAATDSTAADGAEKAGTSVSSTAADTDRPEIYSPVKGVQIDISKVGDATFAEKMLGDGVAFEPVANEIYAPCDGVITTVFPTYHALGFKGYNGAEILLHIGVNTVSLDGKYFDLNPKAGQHVKAGDLLGIVDFDGIKSAGLDQTVILIVTDEADCKLEIHPNTAVTRQNMVMSLRAA